LLPWLAALPGGRFAVPLVAPLTLYFAFRERVRAGRHGGAWSLGVAWAALLSLGFILQVFLAPDLAATTLRGEPYRQEMFHWIATGEGSEGEWRRFLPTHLSHFTLFVVLCWVSGGYLGLVLGAVLMGYMSYFVGSYAAAAGAPLLGSLVAWVPWSVIRVLAFILVGCLFARPLLVRRIWPFERRELRLLLLGLAGILADILLKALAADTYGVFLRGLAGGGVG
jgi:hypothetical protein